MSIGNLLVILLVYMFIIRPLIRKLTVEHNYPHMKDNPYKQAQALRVMYIVAREVAQADGRETSEELNMVVTLVREFFGRPDKDANEILSEYQHHANEPWNDSDTQSLSARYRMILFSCALHVAMSDRVITSAEIAKIRQIGARLNIPRTAIENSIEELKRALHGSQRTSHTGQSINAVDFAYEVLQLKQGATAKEIKRQYQRLAMKNHPDRVPAADKKAATERFKEIGDAYKILKERA